jgi:hypothetical protein
VTKTAPDANTICANGSGGETSAPITNASRMPLIAASIARSIRVDGSVCGPIHFLRNG